MNTSDDDDDDRIIAIAFWILFNWFGCLVPFGSLFAMKIVAAKMRKCLTRSVMSAMRFVAKGKTVFFLRFVFLAFFAREITRGDLYSCWNAVSSCSCNSPDWDLNRPCTVGFRNTLIFVARIKFRQESEKYFSFPFRLKWSAWNTQKISLDWNFIIAVKLMWNFNLFFCSSFEVFLALDDWKFH